MKKKREKEIIKIIRCIREMFSIPETFFDLKPIIESIGLKLEAATFENDEIICFTNFAEKKIIVNRNLPFEEKRFAIAKELGRIILHHKNILKNPKIYKPQTKQGVE